MGIVAGSVFGGFFCGFGPAFCASSSLLLEGACRLEGSPFFRIRGSRGSGGLVSPASVLRFPIYEGFGSTFFDPCTKFVRELISLASHGSWWISWGVPPTSLDAWPCSGSPSGSGQGCASVASVSSWFAPFFGFIWRSVVRVFGWGCQSFWWAFIFVFFGRAPLRYWVSWGVFVLAFVGQSRGHLLLFSLVGHSFAVPGLGLRCACRLGG